MIIIADSGSTKTDWTCIMSPRTVFNQTTEGFNPVYFPATVLENSIHKLMLGVTPDEVSHIYFYGSGCSSEEANKTVREVFGRHFQKATTEVHHDLFGSARALFGNSNGIAAILGTGSSSCLVENGRITHAVPSLGYLLADEGSGMHLGKLLINAYFKDDLPQNLSQKFEADFEIDRKTFISTLYAREKANAYIASLTPFVIENKTDEVVGGLIKKAFRAFFTEIILKYPDYGKHPLGFTGSVAFLLREHLGAVAEKFGLKIDKIVKNPLDDLVNFHLEHWKNID